MTEFSESNEWWTKELDYRKWCNQYNIRPVLDAFGRVHSMCVSHLEDAFTEEWRPNSYLTNLVHDESVYFNPPLTKGMTKKSILRAFDQWQKHNVAILGVVPAGVIARQYFEPIWELFKKDRVVDIEPIRPRPSFLYKGKEVEYQARNDYITLFFKKQ